MLGLNGELSCRLLGSGEGQLPVPGPRTGPKPALLAQNAAHSSATTAPACLHPPPAEPLLGQDSCCSHCRDSEATQQQTRCWAALQQQWLLWGVRSRETCPPVGTACTRLPRIEADGFFLRRVYFCHSCCPQTPGLKPSSSSSSSSVSPGAVITGSSYHHTNSNTAGGSSRKGLPSLRLCSLRLGVAFPVQALPRPKFMMSANPGCDSHSWHHGEEKTVRLMQQHSREGKAGSHCPSQGCPCTPGSSHRPSPPPIVPQPGDHQLQLCRRHLGSKS